MKKIFKPRNILFGLIVFLAVAQFFKIDKNNPEVNSDQDFISVQNPTENIALMVKNQCYDCHSNETKYPWYSDYAPISWWLKSNINSAREELNFSTWNLYSEKEKIAKLEDIKEALEEGEMPVAAYVMMHEEAQFSEEEVSQLKEYFNSLEP